MTNRLMLSCKTTLPKKRDSVKWQEYEPEPWKTSLHCVMQTTRALQSHLTPRSRAFGFGIKTVTKIDHNLQERFECTSEDDFTPRPSLRKEYMSELMTMEDNSTKFAGTCIIHATMSFDCTCVLILLSICSELYLKK